MNQSDNFPIFEMTYNSPEYNPEDETHKNIEKELQTQLNNDIINNYDQKISSIQKILSDISVTLDLNTLFLELTRKEILTITGIQCKGQVSAKELAQ